MINGKVALIAFSLVAGAIAQAQILYTWPVTKGGVLAGGGFNVIALNKFTTNSDTTAVTALGYEINDNKSVGQVGIFDLNGNRLTSANIDLTTNLEGGYYWEQISPLVLAPNTSYYIGALVPIAMRYQWDTNIATLPSGFIDGSTWYSAQSWTNNLNNIENSNTKRHYVGNMRVSAVPEPTSTFALTLGIVALLRSRRRLA